MPPQTVVVIGGGPAGLMAAGQAALAGARAVLLEKMTRPARKLGITGKGRCNLTNTADPADFIARFGPTGPFLRQAFARFGNTDLMDFFSALELHLVVERGGRVFPESGRATDVQRTLVQWARRCGVQLRTGCAADKLIIEGDRVAGVGCSTASFPCDAVILATGGAAYPATGSTGDGYRIAAAAGHSIVPIRPALVPLVAVDVTQPLSGLSLRNAGVRLLVNGKKRADGFGELQFTPFGLSGPVILTLSGVAVDALRRGERTSVAIDLKPALNEQKLDARIERDCRRRGAERLGSVLRGLLPREMVSLCLTGTRLPAGYPAGRLTGPERRRLRSWLKDVRFEVTGFRPFAEAIVTAGGIDTREVDPRTMASRLVAGLHLAGEVLDVQADTGGYNLQAAFSTGWVAGRAAADARRP